MAVSMPNTMPGIARVQDPNNYLNEIFDYSPDPTLPSFNTFLSEVRGIPADTFSAQAKEILALIMETTAYSTYCNMIKQRQQQQKESEAGENRMDNWLDQVPVEEIDQAIVALNERISQLKSARASKVAVDASAN